MSAERGVDFSAFLSTPSSRRATEGERRRRSPSCYFYPRPPRGGRRRPRGRVGRALPFLSTPSSRRATTGSGLSTLSGTDFYPRPPRGGRLRCVCGILGVQRFLSTPSARRATRCLLVYLHRRSHFYPRPPRGGRLLFSQWFSWFRKISIHALREEGDIQQMEIVKYT